MISCLPLVAVLLSLATSSEPIAAPASWEKLYENTAHAQWLTSVWLKDDGTWRAGGKDFFVWGDGKAIRTSDIPGYVVYAFGEDVSGHVVAVGSRQAIWEEQGDELKRVHELPGPPPKGRAAYRDILEGVGYLDPARPDRLVAYGSLHLVLSRETNGEWHPTGDDGLAKRGSLGPEPTSPPGCHPAGWHWLGRTNGLLDCHEGQAYLYAGSTGKAVGRLPGSCRQTMAAAAQDGSDLFVACGEKTRLWHRGAGGDAWSEVPGVSDVRAIQARKGCLLVATKRAVFRRYSAAAPGTAGSGPVTSPR